MSNRIQLGLATPTAQPNEQPIDQGDKTSRRAIVAGSLVGAILASSCCIVPLLLVSIGMSGAWIGTLTVLEPFKPYFVAATLVLLAAGYWHVYIKPRPACAAGSYCASPSSERITKLILWLATAVVMLAATINYWAPIFY